MNQECEKKALHKNSGDSYLMGQSDGKYHKKEVCNLEGTLKVNFL